MDLPVSDAREKAYSFCSLGSEPDALDKLFWVAVSRSGPAGKKFLSASRLKNRNSLAGGRLSQGNSAHTSSRNSLQLAC